MTQTTDLPDSVAAFEKMAEALFSSPDYQVVRRFDSNTLFLPNVPSVSSATVGIGVVLDTETTGRDPEVDCLVELGMVKFAFDRATGNLLGVISAFNALEDPGMPIDPAASAVNGITDDMVKGLRIDDAEVLAMLEGVDFVVAHNSKFDRPISERRFPFFKGFAWACTLTQIDWSAAGINSAKLDYIAYRLGFFFEAHRAEADCLALLNAVSLPLPGDTPEPGLRQLLGTYQLEGRRIWAVAAPFDAKDDLKKRGYRWSDGAKPETEKAWWIEVTVEECENELLWLKENVFRNKSVSLPVDKIDAFNRFTDRRVSLGRVYC